MSARAEARRVVVVDSWAVLRRGIVGVLHGQHVVVASAEDLAAGLAAVHDRPSDLLLVGECHDFDVEVLMDGVRRVGHPPWVIVLRDEVVADDLVALLRAGVRAVVRRDLGDDELIETVDRVGAGDRVVDQRYLPLLYETDTAPAAASQESILTPRETEVLLLLSQGLGNREIADKLFVSEATVKTHLSNIYDKLGVHDRHRAVGRAIETGLLR